MMILAVRCAGSEGGYACMDAATETTPVPLCTRHRVQVALSIVPEMLAKAAGTVAMKPQSVDSATARLVRCAKHRKLDVYGLHEPRVYFISNGAQVKIGYTTNLRTRLSSLMLRANAVELFLEGGRDLEKALHRYFANARIDQTEWFHRTPEVAAYIHEKARRPLLTEPAAPRLVLPPEAEVDLNFDELNTLAWDNIGDANGVHLASLLKVAKAAGAPKEWRVAGLRRAYERHGFRVRKAVRVGQQVSVGLHRDDLQAVSAPDPDNPARTRVTVTDPTRRTRA